MRPEKTKRISFVGVWHIQKLTSTVSLHTKRKRLKDRRKLNDEDHMTIFLWFIILNNQDTLLTLTIMVLTLVVLDMNHSVNVPKTVNRRVTEMNYQSKRPKPETRDILSTRLFTNFGPLTCLEFKHRKRLKEPHLLEWSRLKFDGNTIVICVWDTLCLNPSLFVFTGRGRVMNDITSMTDHSLNTFHWTMGPL